MLDDLHLVFVVEQVSILHSIIVDNLGRGVDRLGLPFLLRNWQKVGTAVAASGAGSGGKNNFITDSSNNVVGFMM